MDVASLGFYTDVECPHCGYKDHVHTLLANFRLEGILGYGGMSIVLRGRDVVLGRPVAIKLLNELYRNQPERIARFENECSMMAKVHHENVVSVYSAGWAKEQFYIAMELLEGRNLETIVAEKGPLSPIRAIEVITKVVKGLEAAHIAGLLHRDMKPGNVIITDAGIPKVLDFGLAQSRSADEDTEEVIWATPYYVSPETLQRGAEDARTDIYSVGMTLRYLLTGTDTLPGNPASVSALLDAKYQLASFAQQMPKAEPSLCELIDRMTAFAPEARHDNYADLLAELNEVHEVLSEKHLRRVSPEKRRMRRRNMACLCGGVALASAVTFCLGRCVGTPEPQRYAIPEVNVVVTNQTVLEPILTALAKEQFAQALEASEKLASPQVESTMAAWGLLHGACVAYLEQKGVDKVDALLSMFKLALDGVNHSPAADSMRHQLELARQALDTPERVAEISDRRVRAMVHCLLVLRLLEEGKVEQAKQAISAAKDEFRLTNEPPYSTTLYKKVDQLEVVYADSFAAASYQQAISYMSQHNFECAEQSLKALPASATANPEEVKVLLELCECGVVLCDTLKRLMKEDYVPGITAQQFLVLNKSKKYVDSLRETEFYTLLLLLQHDYAAAFETNPYAQKPNSTNPFAVMMRDWQTRLTPHIKE